MNKNISLASSRAFIIHMGHLFQAHRKVKNLRTCLVTILDRFNLKAEAHRRSRFSVEIIIPDQFLKNRKPPQGEAFDLRVENLSITVTVHCTKPNTLVVCQHDAQSRRAFAIISNFCSLKA